MSKNILPPGVYVLTDPCYVYSKWDLWINEFFAATGENDSGGVFRVEDTACAAFYTEYGDGRYESSEGHWLGVDSGTIGLVPIALVDKADEEDLNVIRLREPTKCSCEDGVIRFGDLTINTGDDHDEECECS